MLVFVALRMHYIAVALHQHCEPWPMSSPFVALTSEELLALAVEATRRGDSGHSMAYLKEAASRDDAPADALFLLGSEYAQIGLVAEAAASFERALEVAPGHALARFQLGLLHLTSGEPAAAQIAWGPLAELPPSHPHAAFLAAFHRGLVHLIKDEFAPAVRELERGIELNLSNAALNGDMRKIVDAVRSLPGVDLNETNPPGAASDERVEDAAGHLFINAYTRGKPH